VDECRPWTPAPTPHRAPTTHRAATNTRPRPPHPRGPGPRARCLRQGLTLVPVSAQLELTLPLSAQLKLTVSPISPDVTRGCVLKVLKLSSKASDKPPKVLKLSSEVSECKPLVSGGAGRGRAAHGRYGRRRRRRQGLTLVHFSAQRKPYSVGQGMHLGVVDGVFRRYQGVR